MYTSNNFSSLNQITRELQGYDNLYNNSIGNNNIKLFYLDIKQFISFINNNES